LLSSLRNNELIKNAAFLIGSNGFAQIITLLLYPLIARLFTPGEFGQLAVIVSLHSLLATAASVRYEQAIVLPENDAQAADLFRLGWRIAVLLSLLIAPVVFLIRHLGFLSADWVGATAPLIATATVSRDKPLWRNFRFMSPYTFLIQIGLLYHALGVMGCLVRS